MRKFNSITIASSVLISLFLVSCSDKSKSTSNESATRETSEAEISSPYKDTEKFGSVSATILKPVFSVPESYKKYIHQEISEYNNDEYQEAPNSVFEEYIKKWVVQGASIDNPDWNILARVTQPGYAGLTNEFKKQEGIDKIKNSIEVDKNALNVVVAWKNDYIYLKGPDATTGEYYITIDGGFTTPMVSYTTAEGHDIRLYYQPSLRELGLQKKCSNRNCNSYELTVKVPIEKAKEIEAFRDGKPKLSKDFVRLYGKVTKSLNEGTTMEKLTARSLELEVQALEVGARVDGRFNPYFFVDSDELKKIKR
ncbi:hypothetical protein [Acidovorax sp. SD340]|uniref:Lipoprotein n=3 Tax=Acidovorax TaxID=12916 RepID=A0ABV8DG70_9BURK|nr:hypothetical protein [Acidovorax sp. SD340]